MDTTRKERGWMSRWQGPDRERTTLGSSTAKNATDVDGHVCVATSSCTVYRCTDAQYRSWDLNRRCRKLDRMKWSRPSERTPFRFALYYDTVCILRTPYKLSGKAPISSAACLRKSLNLADHHPEMIVHLSGGLEAGLASDQGHVHRRRGQSH